jgi:membrane-associated HD superfamily phosphohydrolase
VDKGVLDTVLEISQSALLPNLKYDQKENARRIREIVRHYPSKVIHYDPGDVLVPFRKVLKEEDLLLLVSHHESVKKDLFGNTPWIFVVIFLILVFHDRFLSRTMGIGWRKTLPYRSLLSVLILSVCLFKACLLFTPFPVYFVPFAMLPLLIAILNYGGVVAICSTVTGAILLTLFTARTFETFVFFTLGGWVAVLLSLKIQKRIHVLLPSLAAGIINVCVILAFSTKLESVMPLLGNWTETWISSQTMVLDKGVLVAGADDANLFKGYAALYQVLLDCIGPHGAQVFVVGFGAALIAMTGDNDLGGFILGFYPASFAS